jgi:2,4-dienoyl-CoA reductase-like NADH-dependent reductase (Old Yellow Enzyme family)
MVRMAPQMPPEVIESDGSVTEAIIEHYRVRARSGTALIIVEATCVDPSGRAWKQGLNAYDECYTDGLSRLAQAITAEGAVAGIELVHAGPQAKPSLCGGVTYGPSAVPASPGEPEPVALSLADILAVEQRFLDAAHRVFAAGFRFIELHAGHGYLLDSFISPVRNRRADAFGGCLENRMRMISDILLRLKVSIGGEAALGARISPFSHAAEGFGPQDVHGMIRILEEAGSDFVDLSTDGVLSRALGSDHTVGQIAHEVTKLPLIAAGGIVTAEDAERALNEGHADVVAVGRAMLSDPQWSAHALKAVQR